MTFDINLLAQVMDKIPLAVTVCDLDGTMHYFNEYASKIINRKPEHLGKDIRLCHRPESGGKIEKMIAEFKTGRREPFRYEARPYTRPLLVTVTPLEVEGRLWGFIHAVFPKP